MEKIISTSLDELIQLEEDYSRKNKRPSGNIRNRITNREKILFCYYEITKQWGFGIFPELVFYILTDLKLVASETGTGFTIRYIDITLDKIKGIQIIPKKTLIVSSGVVITGYLRFYTMYDHNIDTIYLFRDLKDGNFLQEIGSSIIQAKANLEFNLRSSNISKPSPFNSNSMVEQLEKLVELYKSGVLSDDEYKRAKERVISKN